MVDRLTLVTYNVHSWDDERFRCGYKRILATLQAEKPDVITLNEVMGRRELHSLARELGMHVVFGPAEHKTFGNAVLARGRILDHDIHYLNDTNDTPAPTTTTKKTKKKKKKSGKRYHGRCVVVAQVEGLPFRVAATHLDHVSEEWRKSQARRLLDVLSQYAEEEEEGKEEHGAPVVVMGDFNTYRLADYSPAQWQRIVQERTRNGWEAACEGVWPLITEAGYRDARLELAAVDEKTEFRTAHSSDPMYRIDYAFLGAGVVGMGWKVVKHEPVTTATGSDHLPVVTVLERTRRKVQ